MAQKPRSSSRPPPRSEEPEDSFVAWTLKATTWLKTHRSLLTGILVLLALGAAGGVYYRNYQNNLTATAATELESIHQSFGLGDPQTIESDLNRFLSTFGGTPMAAEARLLLGQLYLDAGRRREALSILEPAGEDPDGPMAIQAAFLLAAAYEEQARWNDAERSYLRIAKASDLNFQRRAAWANAARIRTREGDSPGAVELYEELIASFEEGDPAQNPYRMRLAELQTALAR